MTDFEILEMDEYKCINIAVLEKDRSNAVNYYTSHGWDYCQSCAGDINGCEVVFLKFSKSFD